MTLSAGSKLAHYEIPNLLGKGGMGEVYKARDQRLGRNVAITAFPEEFTKDTGRVARFQREAKLPASVNNPNIAAINGVEESDGKHFLVLEFVEGDTLSDRLKHGAIPVDETLNLNRSIKLQSKQDFLLSIELGEGNDPGSTSRGTYMIRFKGAIDLP